MIGNGRSQWKTWRIDGAGVAVCLLAAVTLYITIVHPSRLRHRDHAAQQMKLESRRQAARKLADQDGLLKAQLQELNQALRDTPLKIREARFINNRLADVAQLAGACDLKIDQMQPGRRMVGSHYETIPIYLNGAGTYPTFARLLHELHEQNGFADTGIVSFDLSGDPASDSEDASFKLELAWHTAPGAPEE